MAQVLTREFDCLTCHKPIKISKIENPAPGQKRKWERFELDGITPHECKKKEEAGHISGNYTARVNDGPSSLQQIAVLTQEVRGLRETVNILISQIQSLRSEIKSKK